MYKKTSKKLIHCIAHCNDCEFQAELYTTAAREGSKHCKKTGHTVSVEEGLTYQIESSNPLPA